MTLPAGLDRRDFLAFCAALGLSPAVAAPLGGHPIRIGPEGAGGPRASLDDPPPITRDAVRRAAALVGLDFTDVEIDLMLEDLAELRDAYATLRETTLENAVLPALRFDPLLPGRHAPVDARPFRPSEPGPVERPADLAEVAFWPVTRLGALLRRGGVTSVELAELFLDRLERHGPTLACVVSLTPDLALAQARQADREIAAGRWRSPLHGIPWGAKDLLAARGTRTTWGARPFRERALDADATVVTRLAEAGAVLVAKLTLGALAWGDVWYGGKTRNPWNLEQGSSGSSAGSAAAVVAGLVPFAIGSETLGSIVSPSTRTGATGLRPTFGRVSRHGAMALSWSMDKLGPIARSVEDLALVLEAIRGPDGLDPTVVDAPFGWDPAVPLADLRVGFLADAFAAEREERVFDDAVLEVLRSLGADPVPVELPREPDPGPLRIVLEVEAAAAFDELTRSGRDDELVRQIRNAWPNVFRYSRLIPAVEYLQANRQRTLLMEAAERAWADVDVVVSPTFAEGQLLTTNLTGHPAVVVPSGFRDDGTPVSITFLGRLFGEADALIAARHYQEVTGFHRRRPPGF